MAPACSRYGDSAVANSALDAIDDDDAEESLAEPATMGVNEHPWFLKKDKIRKCYKMFKK